MLEFTAEQHKRYFAEFCVGVQLAGGTTPHMLMAVEAARRKAGDTRAQLWRLGCYAFVYNIASAEVLWQEFDPDHTTQVGVAAWVRANKKGVRFRKERKAVLIPEHLGDCMATYAEWSRKVGDAPWFRNPERYATGAERYEAAFEDFCAGNRYMGRYIGIRWLEALSRTYGLDLHMPDIRPRDGPHPRKALALMYPEQRAILMGGDSPEECAVVNRTAETLHGEMKAAYGGLDVDPYTMQSLLCEYKQSVLAQKQYPGKSVDSELKYRTAIEEYWGAGRETIFWDVRAAIFPAFVLGERSGWTSVRDELGGVLCQHGYTWSDAVYDYRATRTLAEPALRGT